MLPSSSSSSPEAPSPMHRSQPQQAQQPAVPSPMHRAQQHLVPTKQAHRSSTPREDSRGGGGGAASRVSRTVWRPSGAASPPHPQRTSSGPTTVPFSAWGINLEVERSMLDSAVGTPGLMEAGCGDPASPTLLMSQALKGKGLVRQWLVDVGAEESPGSLQMREVPARRLGILTSHDAYLIACDYAFVVVREPEQGSNDDKRQLSSEFRVETVVYLWLGRDYKERDSLRKQVKADVEGRLFHNILHDGGMTDDRQIMKVVVDQGREPPYLLGLFADRLGGVLVLDGSCGGRKRSPAGTMRVFEVCEVPAPSAHNAVSGLIAMEVDVATVRVGLLSDRTHMFMVNPCPSTQSFDTLWVRHGAGSSPRLTRFVHALGARPRMLFAPGRRGQTPRALLRGYVNHLVVGMGIPEELMDFAGDVDCKLSAAERPVRLWKVHYKRAHASGLRLALESRVPGAATAAGSPPWSPYIVEIGPLSCFHQADLHTAGSFLVDAGREDVFVWHGAKASTKTRELAVRAGKVYATAIRDARWRSNAIDLALKQVDEGSEPVEFIGCFRGWQMAEAPGNPLAPTSSPSVRCIIDPHALSAEDEHDIKALQAEISTHAAEDTSPPRAPNLLSDDEVDERGDLWWDLDIAVSPSDVAPGAPAPHGGEDVSYLIVVDDRSSGSQWKLERQLLDFRSLEMLIGRVQADMPELPPRQFDPSGLGEDKTVERMRAVADALQTWLSALVASDSGLPPRARFRLHSFLLVSSNLKRLMEAADADWFSSVSDEVPKSTCADFLERLPRQGLYGKIAVEMMEIRNNLRSEQAAFKYRISEMQKRVAYAAAQEEAQRNLALSSKKEADSLLKKRKNLRLQIRDVRIEQAQAAGGRPHSKRGSSKSPGRDEGEAEDDFTVLQWHSPGGAGPPSKPVSDLEKDSSSSSVWKKIGKALKGSSPPKTPPPVAKSLVPTVQASPPSPSQGVESTLHKAKAQLAKIDNAILRATRLVDEHTAKAQLSATAQSESSSNLASLQMAMSSLFHGCEVRIDGQLLLLSDSELGQGLY